MNKIIDFIIHLLSLEKSILAQKSVPDQTLFLTSEGSSRYSKKPIHHRRSSPASFISHMHKHHGHCLQPLPPSLIWRPTRTQMVEYVLGYREEDEVVCLLFWHIVLTLLHSFLGEQNFLMTNQSSQPSEAAAHHSHWSLHTTTTTAIPITTSVSITTVVIICHRSNLDV
ncbi:hypothetical protein L1887_14933 [Cichorium endivia]|nr:hypothetical protein L1887_14933 [Cichorium endivia]